MSDLYEITEGFDDPFYSGSSGSTLPEEQGFPVSLEGRGYLIDWNSQVPFTRRSVDLLNTQQAQSEGDQSQVPPNIWRRVMESFHQGDGQARLDRVDSLPYRYSTSSGIDPWTPWRLSLLHGTSKVRTIADATVTVTVTGYVVVVGNTHHDWFNGTTWTSGTTLTSAAVAVTSDGTSVYVLHADGKITAWTGPTTSTTFMGTAVTDWSTTGASLNVVKGFLVLGTENVLWDVTGTPATIYTHPNVNFRWGQACDGQQAGYIIGGSGDRWHIFALTLTDTAATLNPPTIATTLPDGEIPTAISEYLGFVLIGSQQGFRLADSSNGTLTYGRLVTTDAPVECFEGQDRFVWYGRSQTAGHSGLGRADLSTFTSALTPAVAPDLEADTFGRVLGVATVGEKRIFVVQGSGAYLEADTFVSEGTLETGAITFGTSDQKQGTYVQALYDSLASAGTITIEYRKDGGTWEEIGSSVTGVTMGNLPLTSSFTTLELRITLTPSVDGNQSPSFTRIEARAVVVPGRASEFTVPVLLHEVVDYEGATTAMDVIESFDHLLGLAQSRRSFQYREGTRRFQVYAADYSWFPHAEAHDMSTFQGTFVILLREVL